jgi:hypothetical protein
MSQESSELVMGNGDLEEGPTLLFVQKLLSFLEVCVLLRWMQSF